MKYLAATMMIALAALAGAQDWAKEKLNASGRHQEWVELKNGERKVKAFVAYPERKDKATVVVLIHEIMGLSDWVMLVADQLAAEGFIAIAPDFLSGMAPGGGRTVDFADVGKAREAIGALPPDQVVGDLNAAVNYGRQIPAANGKVAVAGFCWGGAQTFRYATYRPDLDAALVFYGTGPTDAESHKRIKAPVYGFYGGNDNRVNATIGDSQKHMADAGKKFDPQTYEGAGHGFMRSGQQPDAQEANKKARDSAWKRMVAILKAL